MSLLEPPAEQPQKSRAMTITVIVVLLVAAIALYFTFRYYPEKKATMRFFDALIVGDTAKAYTLWKPTASYTMNDFLADWGPSGYYGPVKSYKIMGAKSVQNSSSIAVNVAISPYSTMPDPSDGEKSQKTKVVPIWVLPTDKSLSFPVPY